MKKSPKVRSRNKKLTLILCGFVIAIGAAVLSLLIQKQGSAQWCANSISCLSNLSGEFEENQDTAVFLGENIPVPSSLTQSASVSFPILGESTLIESGSTEQKTIYIDLTAQKLYAHQGDKIVFEMPISSGKWGQTPTGEFLVWSKLKFTRMKGGNKELGTYYNLPNVPYTMFFESKDVPRTRGFGIHGAYWHNNFGHPMSHGCVNLAPTDAEKLYYWADPPVLGITTQTTKESPGTKIVIYGTTPVE